MSREELLAVLCNPPTTDGSRTRARVAMLADVLSFDRVVIGNLYAFPTRSVTELADVADNEDGWRQARQDLAPLLGSADAVLCAWGTRSPPGAAGAWHREQMAWLMARIEERDIPTLTVGDSPRHPSRWQRWTSRHWPDLDFPAALARSCTVIGGSRETESASRSAVAAGVVALRPQFDTLRFKDAKHGRLREAEAIADPPS